MFSKDRIRELIVLLGVLVFLLLGVLFPEHRFNEESVIAFAVLIGAYLLGEGLEGPRILENAKQLLLSAKFQSVIAGVLVLVVRGLWPDFPMTEDQVIPFIGVLVTVILNAGVKGYIARSQGAG